MKIIPLFRSVALVASLLLSPVAADAQIDIPLREIKVPNNAINDGEYGVSMTYPEGWDVTRAARWGQNNEKTTLVLQRPRPASPIVSFFYQKFI